MKKIVIAGGSGFLGQVLEAYFTKKGYQISILTRNPKRSNEIYWDAKTIGSWVSSVEHTDALINLTGKSVDCRYTEQNKELIYSSRIDSTNVLGQAINTCNHPPKVWFNSSTATIYRHSLDKEMSEKQGKIGADFSVNIAKAWENTFDEINTPKTRKIILRTAIVLGNNGGALIPLKRLTKFMLGGKQGSGDQKVSWIHESDFAKAVAYLLKNEHLSGVFNVSVPNPIDNMTLMQALRKVLKIPIGIAHPTWLLEIGAKLIGTETELILKSRNVIPERLLENGFRFNYPNIDRALQNLLG